MNYKIIKISKLPDVTKIRRTEKMKILVVICFENPKFQKLNFKKINIYKITKYQNTNIPRMLKSRKLRIQRIVTLNWVLRRMFGPKEDEVAGGWKKLRNGDEK
jgi:hypothetical protein